MAKEIYGTEDEIKRIVFPYALKINKISILVCKSFLYIEINKFNLYSINGQAHVLSRNKCCEITYYIYKSNA